jgi:hypothetical protein
MCNNNNNNNKTRAPKNKAIVGGRKVVTHRDLTTDQSIP